MTTIPIIIAAVAAAKGLTPAQLVAEDKSAHIAQARFLAMWLAHKMVDATLEEIGNEFRRCKTTVLRGIEAHEERIAKDPDARECSMALLDRFIREERIAA